MFPIPMCGLHHQMSGAGAGAGAGAGPGEMIPIPLCSLHHQMSGAGAASGVGAGAGAWAEKLEVEFEAVLAGLRAVADARGIEEGAAIPDPETRWSV